MVEISATTLVLVCSSSAFVLKQSQGSRGPIYTLQFLHLQMVAPNKLALSDHEYDEPKYDYIDCVDRHSQ